MARPAPGTAERPGHDRAVRNHDRTKAVRTRVPEDVVPVDPLAGLAAFRRPRTRLTGTRINRRAHRWPPPARLKHPFPDLRCAATTRGRNPVREQPTRGSARGAARTGGPSRDRLPVHHPRGAPIPCPDNAGHRTVTRGKQSARCRCPTRWPAPPPAVRRCTRPRQAPLGSRLVYEVSGLVYEVSGGRPMMTDRHRRQPRTPPT